MIDYKLQIGCLLVCLYFISAYIKESLMRKLECNRVFDVLLIVSPWTIVFDALTAWSVNHLEMVPTWVNIALHGVFFITFDLIVILDYLYIVDKIIGLQERKTKILAVTPAILSVIGIVAFLPQLQFIVGKNTNYSMGISVIFCFASLIVHSILIIIVIASNIRFISREKLFDIAAFVALCIAVLWIQIVYPEILISALLPTFSLIVLYMAFENPALVRLQKYNSEMVTGFATLVENRDDSTGGHIQRTKGYVQIILRELYKQPKYREILTKDYIDDVISAAPMHDIGKIATPDHILQKKGKLTDDEYEIMKEHSKTGGDIIKKTFSNLEDPEYQKIAYDVARYHHEKWNGKGYPDGLVGEEIPLHARIMAVADVFDAVSAKRCYRDALPIETCFKIIEEGVGTDFDPDIANTFLGARERILKYYERNK